MNQFYPETGDLSIMVSHSARDFIRSFKNTTTGGLAPRRVQVKKLTPYDQQAEVVPILVEK
jgi:hypothetical protein